MKNKSLYRLTVVFALLALFSQLASAQKENQLSKKEKKEGWELLFNGSDFSGWRMVNKPSLPEKGWLANNGTIICTGDKGGSLITEEQFGDFELEWEWRFTSVSANSGIKYYVTEYGEGTEGKAYGIEYQLIDDTTYVSLGEMELNDFHTTGAAYELYPPSPKKKIKKIGKWNNSKIVSDKGKIAHWLNGKKILEFDRFSEDFKEKVAKSKFKDIENFGVNKEGHILLQDHNSVVFFRNIKIKKLGAGQE